MENRMATITKFPCKRNCICIDCQSKCKCCGANKVVVDEICLWCQKDGRKVALFEYFPHICKYYLSPIRFCRGCLKAIANEDAITDWIVNEWDSGTYMTADGREMEDEEFIYTYYSDEFELLCKNLCQCCEWSEGYWDDDENYIKNTLTLDDVQCIETIRTKKKEKELAKQLAKELTK